MSRIDLIGQNGNEGLHYTNMKDYSKYIHKSRYARWLDEENRRESWEETVDRICSFWVKRIKESDLPEEEKEKIIKEIG